MPDPTPDWLGRVRELDIRAEQLRAEQTDIADQRAHIIAQAVADHGRGGRDHVAAQLGISVGQIDQALRRAREGAGQDDDLTVMRDAIAVLLRPGVSSATRDLAQGLATRRLDAVARRVQNGLRHAHTSSLTGADIDALKRAADTADRVLSEAQ